MFGNCEEGLLLKISGIDIQSVIYKLIFIEARLIDQSIYCGLLMLSVVSLDKT